MTTSERVYLSRAVTRPFAAVRRGARGPRTIGAFLADDELRAMFDAIGSRYDLQNGLLSLGWDARWRRTLAGLVAHAGPSVVCDMSTGTGEVAIAIARRHAQARIIGVDYSAGMLERARAKVAACRLDRRISLVRGDVRNAPVESGAADVVTNAFGLRNIPERARVLAEFRRVLRPGGRLYVLDFGFPRSRVVGAIYRAYFDHVMPTLGNLLSGTDYAYSYLKLSIHGFPQPAEFERELESAGFTGVRTLSLSYGLAYIYRGIRA